MKKENGKTIENAVKIIRGYGNTPAEKLDFLERIHTMTGKLMNEIEEGLKMKTLKFEIKIFEKNPPFLERKFEIYRDVGMFLIRKREFKLVTVRQWLENRELNEEWQISPIYLKRIAIGLFDEYIKNNENEDE